MKHFSVVAGVVILGAVTFWAFTGPTIESVEAGIRVPADTAYDPVKAGEALPEGFRQLLQRDGIAPIYDPHFVTAAQAGWPGDAHVIGVSSGDEAKAYPVSHLNQREMVIDEIEGIPILVSW